eukprot:TRINITY_DN4201_c0_g1_i4.p1 TRINITY_DN4201_c0_g1~~TRINITY_DN4201_c0_g1_i4.p1  ORF type:complete len:132 (+),score=3.15 TRINITY_DN4201_c0_g1_i4:113-508(+)
MEPGNLSGNRSFKQEDSLLLPSRSSPFNVSDQADSEGYCEKSNKSQIIVTTCMRIIEILSLNSSCKDESLKCNQKEICKQLNDLLDSEGYLFDEDFPKVSDLLNRLLSNSQVIANLVEKVRSCSYCPQLGI